MFLDELSREAILELVVSTYLNSIKLEDEDKKILFEFQSRVRFVENLVLLMIL